MLVCFAEREIYRCKQCNGTGSYVGSVEGKNGEEEPVEVQCDCDSQIIHQITEALLEYGKAVRDEAISRVIRESNSKNGDFASAIRAIGEIKL